eukprot:1491-Heterococcus_DN1.PRE.2
MPGCLASCTVPAAMRSLKGLEATDAHSVSIRASKQEWLILLKAQFCIFNIDVCLGSSTAACAAQQHAQQRDSNTQGLQ